MKIDRRWVAGTAALLMAAMLTAMPREGAAWPIRYYDWMPQFGEPDTPSGRAELARRESSPLGKIWVQPWAIGSSTPLFVILYEPRSPKTTLTSKAARHE